MIDRLKAFLIEIECPSGAKLVGDLQAVAEMVAQKASLPGLTPTPAEILTQIENVESNIFAYIWSISFKDLLGVMRAKGVGDLGLAGDQLAWTEVVNRQAADAGPVHAPTPFMIRIVPRGSTLHGEPVGHGATFTRDEIGDIIEGLTHIGNLAGSMGQGFGSDVEGDSRLRIQGLAKDLRATIFDRATAPIEKVQAPVGTSVLSKILLEIKTATDDIRAINLGPAPSDDAMNKATSLQRLMEVVSTLEKALEAVEVPAPEKSRIALIACPNPDHKDTHPSCRLNTETGDYFCLACGAKGKFRDGAFYAMEDGLPLDSTGDGWGHTHEAETVEDLLREGEAMLKGTDKHEQVFKGTDEEVQGQRLAAAIERLTQRLNGQLEVLAGHTKLIQSHAEAIRTLQSNQGGLTSTVQKLYRRVKLDQTGAAYGAAPRSSLWARHDEIQKLIEFAKMVQKDPVLRALFSL